ncbi:MAG: serine hydroxymethyltransferase [Alphaproteobacteria bacterium]|nr:serine hydroxymethyltransferase [Alphaproteobacteria bacterium]
MGLATKDSAVAEAIDRELARQQDQIELIASENIVSRAVLEAQGSVLSNKTVEGYPGRRYHGGATNVDVIEDLAIERACQLFGCRHANVQPHSGSQANQVVFLSLLRPGDTVLSMALDAGGHLSHGAAPNMSGRWFDIVPYGVRQADGLIDMDAVADLARQHRPKLIIAGGSSYPRVIDFAAFRTIADEVGAHFLVDMAHFAGLVAGGVHPSPLPHAHLVTTTTYKSLRGARGGIVLCDDEALARKINSALFPGMQGSPMLHLMAGKAVCLGEALRPEFKDYAARVLANARALAAALMERQVDVVTGGTDTPLLLIDLRRQGLRGNAASDVLEAAGLTCNKNGVPGDPEPPTVTSGLRLGASAGTTRGLGTDEFREIGGMIAELLAAMATGTGVDEAQARSRRRVTEICAAYPIYSQYP